MSKISIRFYNDREVRAIWDEENSKWWFSAIDIVRAINNESDYVKAGNGRSTRIWLDLILKKRWGKCVDWGIVAKKDYLDAIVASHTGNDKIRELLQSALTDKINDCETFMKGIDYSYYYEQEE